MEFTFGDHILDVERRELRRGGQQVPIQPQVFDLLVYVIRNRDHVVSRDELLAAIWRGRIVSESTLSSRINGVRKAIGDRGDTQQLLRTVSRKGIRFIADVCETHRRVDDGSPMPEQPTLLALSLPEKPSIAVLPFANLTGELEQEYFADGMVEEIITALARIRWLFVIARNSSFTYKGHAIDVKQVGRELGVRYVLEGSVRNAGSRVRIAAQLIDAASDVHLWADRFEGSLRDVFALQDKVALGVSAAIEPALQAAEIRRSGARPTADPTSYDLYLRALADFPTCDRIRLEQGLALLDQSMAHDPDYAPVLALASVFRVELENHGWIVDPDANRAIALDLCRRALRSGAGDPTVLGRAAVGLGRFGEDVDSAIGLIDRALALNPSFADAWYWSGWLRLFAGQSGPAIEHFRASLRLNPRGGQGFHLAGIGAAHFIERRFTEAAALLRASLEELPSFTPTHRILAACYAHMGRLDEARVVVARLRGLTEYVVPTIQLFRDPRHRELFLSGLRLAAD